MGGEEAKTFSAYGHVVYQLKGNDACSNMVANILPVVPSPFPDPGDGVKIPLFQNMVMLHIKLKGIRNAATCKHKFCLYTHLRPLGWGQRSKHFFFLKVVMLHIKLKGMESRAPCKHVFCSYTHPRPLIKTFFF